MEAYKIIGKLFKDLKQDTTDNKINIKLLAVDIFIIDILKKYN